MKNNKKHSFYVLLGGDYSGKSSILELLSKEIDWHIIANSSLLLKEPMGILDTFYNLFIDDLLVRHKDHYSSDFILSGMQMTLVYLRDKVIEGLATNHVLIDSYYYKYLCKCILKRWINKEIFSLWRSFLKPDKILFIQTSPEIAWLRSKEGNVLNRFEYNGETPSWESFKYFQCNLTDMMLEEVNDIPIAYIDGDIDLLSTKGSILDQLNDVNNDKENTAPYGNTHSCEKDI
jgi:thymidylate kinase